jgi:sirohydrochlorin ferrochelatase
VSAPPLVAVAHGSRDPAAGASTEALLEEVRRQRPGLEVVAAYLDHTEPRLADVLAGLHRPADPAGQVRAVVVPLLLAAAYHAGVDIPAAIQEAGGTAVQADVLGPDRLLLDALERRLREAGVAPGDPSTAVVLAAAGSTGEEAVGEIRRLAREWAAAQGWWAVEAAFASAAEPTVEDAVSGLRARGAERVAVATYLLFPGLFADRLATAGADVASGVLGDAPEVARLVLARYDARRGAAP